jgi:hypothetical protein
MLTPEQRTLRAKIAANSRWKPERAGVQRLALRSSRARSRLRDALDEAESADAQLLAAAAPELAATP